MVARLKKSNQSLNRQHEGTKRLPHDLFLEHVWKRSLAEPGSHVANSRQVSEAGITSCREAPDQEEPIDARLPPEHNITIPQERENADNGEFANCRPCEPKKSLQAWVGLVTECCSIVSSAVKNQFLLRRKLQPLLDRFPDIIQDNLVNSKETVEVGKLYVSRSAFRDANERPRAFLSSEEPMTTGEQDVLAFLCKKDPALKSALEDETSAPIKAILVQSAITPARTENESNDSSIRSCCWNCILRFMSALFRKDTPVAVFNFEGVKVMVNHLWNTAWEGRLKFTLVIHFLATVSFMIFASMFGVDTEGLSSSHHLLIARCMISVCLVLTLVVFLNGVYPLPRSFSSISFLRS